MLDMTIDEIHEKVLAINSYLDCIAATDREAIAVARRRRVMLRLLRVFQAAIPSRAKQ